MRCVVIFLIVLTVGCRRQTETSAPLKRSDILRAELKKEEDNLDNLWLSADGEVKAEENRWFDEKLKREHIEAVQKKYGALIETQQKKVDDLKKRVDEAQLAEEGRSLPKPPSRTEKIAGLEKKLSKLKDEWDTLDDAESKLIKGRTPNADGQFTFVDDEGEEAADIESKKQAIMNERLALERDIDALRGSP